MDIFKNKLTTEKKFELFQAIAILTVIYFIASLLFGKPFLTAIIDPLLLFMAFNTLFVLFKYFDKKDKSHEITRKVYFVGVAVFFVLVIFNVLFL